MLTPECFHRHVFCCLCIRPSSLLSLFTLLRPLSLLRPHSNRPISSSLFSICSNFSLYLTLLPLFFFEFPCVLCLSAFSLYSVFSPILLFPQILPCVLKRFSLTTSRKTATTCAENVLTLTPECFHRHVFLLPLHSSLISVFSLYSVFSLISLFSLTLPCVLKRFLLTTSRKQPRCAQKTF